jgi:hypothetical protein
MIRHEITIYNWVEMHCLDTLNRDLEYHREGDLPAVRLWNEDGNLEAEAYYLNGVTHREGRLTAARMWNWNGTLFGKKYIT